MLDVLAAQGIVQANSRVTLTPNNRNNLVDPDGFLVKNWEFAGTGHSDTAVVAFTDHLDSNDRATLVQEHPYLNMVPTTSTFPYGAGDNAYTWLFADVNDTVGVPGKGVNPNPASFFESHTLVQLTVSGVTARYDPSYGEKYTGTTKENRELAFENAAIEGFFVNEPATVREADLHHRIYRDNGSIPSARIMAPAMPVD